MAHKTTYARITAKIIFITLLITLFFGWVYSEYIKKEAITNLTQIDAKKTSMLVFESLYSAMQRGWNKDDLYEIIGRLNRVDESMHVNVYRSQKVADLFGEIPQDKEARDKVKDIHIAMGGKDILNVTKEDDINYLYPVIAKDECLKCHVNATSGDVLGVIDISYPIKDLKVSLNEMTNFFILFIIVFSMVIFLAIFTGLDKYLIKPIRNFATVIQTIVRSNDMTRRVAVDDNIEEIDSIKDIFNSMLDSVEYQFYYDNLTGLPNRRKLLELLEKRHSFYFMIINIDAFQQINDLYGDEVGDSVLKEFAHHLEELIPLKGSLYRLHSDEFAHVCKQGFSLEEFKNFASMILEKISQKSFSTLQNNSINLSATIGISYGSVMLLANADIALKLAKKAKKEFLIYDESMAMEKEYKTNIEWSKRLKRAIEMDRIVPVYQPIVDVKTKKVVKYESLMRMMDDEGGLIAPVHFLELAKKNKLYHQLTKIMIEKTMNKFKGSDFLVSINLSVQDILDKDIYNLIIEKISHDNLGKNIVFEIIESEGIENFEHVLAFINDVKKYGTKISIDDFGTGYSNFEYLMKLKVDYIKIDGSMIKNIDSDENSQMITQTIVEFAKKMKIQTVAEFVCSKNVFDKVATLDVDFAQGYYFGEPTLELLD